MKKLKSITAVLILMLITVSACGKKTESDKEIIEPDTMISESEENEAADNALTETAKTEMIEKESEENGTADSAPAGTDRDIIMRSGHPTYYGSMEKAYEIWSDVEPGRILFGDNSYGTNSKMILSLTSYRNSDLIRGVFINFENFVEENDYSIDDAIKIAASYMPFEIMDQYYEFSGSEQIVPDESRKDDASYFVVSYRLTEEGKNEDHPYSGSIDVIITMSGDTVQNIDITFGTPRWMNSLSMNEYHTAEWECDLSDYRE